MSRVFAKKIKKFFYPKTLDNTVIVCYNYYRKKEREVNKMTKYVVTAYKVEREFTTEERARAYFNEVKHNFTYCELKKVDEDGTRYYAESVEIFRK